MKEMESSISEESSVDYEDNQEFISYSEENQLSYVNLIEETEEDAAITDIPQLQSDVEEEESCESITISNPDLMKEMESSISNEGSVDYEENLESSAKMEGEYFSKADQSDENQMNDQKSDSPELQSDESSHSSVHDPMHASQSPISGETNKVFENTQGFLETGGIDFVSMPDPHFKKIRVPVVLGEYNLDCCVEEVITFKEKVKRINQIYNKVILTNCKVIPTQLSPVLENGTCKASEAYLYFEGFINQTIDYLSLTNGDFYTMRKKTPFTITVKINDFLHPPIFGSIAQTTFEFLDPNNTQISQLDTQLFHSTIYYPEQPYCQMISSKHHQMIYLRDTVNGTNNQSDRTIVGPKKFQLNQKIVVEIFVHLLQIQPIRVRSDDYWS